VKPSERGSCRRKNFIPVVYAQKHYKFLQESIDAISNSWPPPYVV